jgi:hypothetical protein
MSAARTSRRTRSRFCSRTSHRLAHASERIEDNAQTLRQQTKALNRPAVRSAAAKSFMTPQAKAVPTDTSRPRNFLSAERRPLDSLDCREFLERIRDGREPMHLASRTHPKLGRTIISCVFFPTNRLLSRFVSSFGRQNQDIFSCWVETPNFSRLEGSRNGLCPTTRARIHRLAGLDQPHPLKGGCIRSIGKLCAKSLTQISDTDH